MCSDEFFLKHALLCAQLVEPITIFVTGERYCATLIYRSCVHNQIATFGLLDRQSVTLNIGLNIGYSHNRDNRPSEQSAKCNIGQALVNLIVYPKAFHFSVISGLLTW